MLIEVLSGTGVIGWFDKKNGFIPNFLSTCDKFCDTRGFNFKVLWCDGADENKSFIYQMNGKDWKFQITPSTPLMQLLNKIQEQKHLLRCVILRQNLFKAASVNIPSKVLNIMYPPAMMLAIKLQGLKVI